MHNISKLGLYLYSRISLHNIFYAFVSYSRSVGNYMEFIVPVTSATVWRLFTTLRYNRYFLNIESYEILRLTYYQIFTDNIRNLIISQTRTIP